MRMLLAKHNGYHISSHRVEELLRDVVGANGVLKGQVENVVSLYHVPAIALSGTSGAEPDAGQIECLSCYRRL